jgi:cysteine desulfurase/selenocysteine lyase
LGRPVNGKDLVYLDNAASTLKAQRVIDRLTGYYSHEVANIHRGAHYLGDKGTANYEVAREKIARHLGAAVAAEIIFTRGTTESINLVASSLARGGFFRPGDRVVLTQMEHHSNIVPWMMLKESHGLKVEFIPVTDQGDLDLDRAKKLLAGGLRLLSVSHVSNALGTLNPVKELIQGAKAHGALTLVDGAQAFAARPVNVQELGCDFYAASGHKAFGPTGIGVLYGRRDLLNSMPPYQGGGSMIGEVSEEKATFLPAPQRFEAGTPHVAGALGLAEAVDFIQELGFTEIEKREAPLVETMVQGIKEISGFRLIGEPKTRINVVSFLLEGAHPSDVGALLDQQGVAVRAGHHCCMPLMKRFGVPGTVRASVAPYNTARDIEAFLKALRKAKEILS